MLLIMRVIREVVLLVLLWVLLQLELELELNTLFFFPLEGGPRHVTGTIGQVAVDRRRRAVLTPKRAALLDLILGR